MSRAIYTWRLTMRYEVIPGCGEHMTGTGAVTTSTPEQARLDVIGRAQSYLHRVLLDRRSETGWPLDIAYTLARAEVEVDMERPVAPLGASQV
jgi:hypothetical protein